MHTCRYMYMYMYVCMLLTMMTLYLSSVACSNNSPRDVQHPTSDVRMPTSKLMCRAVVEAGFSFVVSAESEHTIIDTSEVWRHTASLACHGLRVYVYMCLRYYCMTNVNKSYACKCTQIAYFSRSMHIYMYSYMLQEMKKVHVLSYHNCAPGETVC